jgi:hypothetical protein
MLVLLAAHGCYESSDGPSTLAELAADAGAGDDEPDHSSVTPQPTWTGTASSCGGPTFDPEVTYDGWAEHHRFRSGSDRVRVMLEDNPDGTVSGFALFGEASHLDPAPSDANACDWLCDEPWASGHLGVQEGFTYAVSNVERSTTRLRFEINRVEPIDPFCRLQTPVRRFEGAESRWGCLPNEGAGVGPSGCYTGEHQPVSCCKLFACDLGVPACECDADECWGSTAPIRFDLFIDDRGIASGAVSDGLFTVHLEPQAP